MERLTKRELLGGHNIAYASGDDCFDVWSVPKKFMGNISARELAAKHGVNANTLMSRASRGKWDAERKAVRAEFERICAQKTMEASAEAEADRLATLVRIGAKAARFLEERLDTLMTCGAKAYEVKAIMETVKLIREVYDSGPRTSEDDPLLAYLGRLKNDG